MRSTPVRPPGTRRSSADAAAGWLRGWLLGLVTLVAGGAVGPGRLQDVGPAAFEVLLHAVTAFGIGGLLGALAVLGWERRARVVQRVPVRLPSRLSLPARFRRD